MDARELEKLAKELTKKMRRAAAELNLREAAKLRTEGSETDAAGTGGSLERAAGRRNIFVFGEMPWKDFTDEGM